MAGMSLSPTLEEEKQTVVYETPAQRVRAVDLPARQVIRSGRDHPMDRVHPPERSGLWSVAVERQLHGDHFSLAD
jgi:hypothetical protein